MWLYLDRLSHHFLDTHGDFVKGLPRCSKLPKRLPLDSEVESCASCRQSNNWFSLAHRSKRFQHRKSVKIFTQKNQEALHGMLTYLNRLLHHFLSMDLPKHSSAPWLAIDQVGPALRYNKSKLAFWMKGIYGSNCLECQWVCVGASQISKLTNSKP